MVESALHIDNKELLDALTSVTDPEIPVLSIMDMGVVRSVILKDNEVRIDITPTYSGCPAMDTIAADIVTAVEKLGYQVSVNLVLSPAWTTDWITPRGRKALEDYGIAVPLDVQGDKSALIDGARIVKCTNCGSTNTKVISQFGSTACKALFRCEDCKEPFDYFKCLK